MTDTRATAWAQRLLRGDIRSGDLAHLFLYARDRKDGRATVREIGDFVAHHNERQKGIVTTATREWLAIVLFHLPHLKNQRQVLFWNALPSVTPDYVRAMIERVDYVQIKKKLRIDRTVAREELKKILKALIKNTDGTYMLLSSGSIQDSLFNFICGVFISKPAFDGAKLADDMVEVLRSSGLWTRDDLRKLPSLKSVLQIYAISMMHNCNITTNDGTLIRLKATRSNEGVSVCTGIVIERRANGATIEMSTPMFHTTLLPENACEPDVLACADWSADMEITSNGRLGFLL